MNIEHPYWYFKSAIPMDTCDEIIEVCSSKPKISGTLGSRVIKEKDLRRTDSKIRDSSIVWVSEEWIYKLIQPYIKIADRTDEDKLMLKQFVKGVK